MLSTHQMSVLMVLLHSRRRYIHVAIMIFVGFGFLMTFLKRYSNSAVALNFFTSCLVRISRWKAQCVLPRSSSHLIMCSNSHCFHTPPSSEQTRDVNTPQHPPRQSLFTTFKLQLRP